MPYTLHLTKAHYTLQLIKPYTPTVWHPSVLHPTSFSLLYPTLSTPFTLHPMLYTLHATPFPCTLYPTSFALYPTPYLAPLHPTPHNLLIPTPCCTLLYPTHNSLLHPTLYTLHSAPYTLHSTPYALYPTACNINQKCTQYKYKLQPGLNNQKHLKPPPTNPALETNFRRDCIANTRRIRNACTHCPQPTAHSPEPWKGSAVMVLRWP